MPANIDIIVRSADSTETKLLVETKLSLVDLARVEGQLKGAMLDVSCPVGIIVTPERMWMYVDEYTSTGPTSIHLVGEFAIGDLLRYKGPGSAGEGRDFENFVQHWLEILPQIATRDRVPNARLWDALNRFVLPAVETGDVRAAAPRY
ncbi:MAG TPA: hypothetical protein VJS43_08400 [Candidatus Acidoferrales bacterium]|nr:hypothetical protein [Candidatus Acidoferrales bacterium]